MHSKLGTSTYDVLLILARESHFETLSPAGAQKCYGLQMLASAGMSYPAAYHSAARRRGFS